MRSILTRLIKDDTGAAAVEYGLLVAAIAAIIVATVFALGGYVEGAFHYTCDQLKTYSTTTGTTSTAAC